MLGLSPKEYDVAKKELFSNKKSLNGVYRHANGRYALVYQKPVRFDARAIAAAVAGGALVASGVGIARAVHNYRSESSESSSDEESTDTEEEEKLGPCTNIPDGLEATALKTALDQCFHTNNEFIKTAESIKRSDFASYETAVGQLTPEEEDREAMLAPYQNQLTLIAELEDLQKSVPQIKAIIRKPTYQFIHQSVEDEQELARMKDILKWIDERDLSRKADAAMLAWPILEALKDQKNVSNYSKFGENIVPLFIKLVTAIKIEAKEAEADFVAKQSESYFENAVSEILGLIKIPNRHDDLEKIYLESKTPNVPQPKKPEEKDLERKIEAEKVIGPERLQGEIEASLVKMEAAIEDGTDISDEVTKILSMIDKLRNLLINNDETDEAIDGKLSPMRSKLEAFTHLNDLRVSKTAVINLLKNDKYKDIIDDLAFKEKLSDHLLRGLLTPEQRKKLAIATKFSKLTRMINENENLGEIERVSFIEYPVMPLDARKELLNYIKDPKNQELEDLLNRPEPDQNY
jgi:hypothetical protein